MVLQIPPQQGNPQQLDVIYPDSDGKPMAENTEQFRWIVVVKENLEYLYANDAQVFVAGDLLWYPVQGNNQICTAPDAMVAIGRPKGRRGSYKQWEEENIAPQVVFEILSPGNTKAEMNRKLLFYDRYGVEEYYLYDPDTNTLNGWLRQEGFLDVIEEMNNWVSPRLQIRFDLTGSELLIRYPDGKPFLSYVQIAQEAEQERQRAEAAEAAMQAAIPKLLNMGLTPAQVAEALGVAVEVVEQMH
ncbi:MAG: Uma2 family endonuclease [Leptolyngbyaceae cyanobacterium bins.349]|nr:Uma2 family endonuclease [Leptolyngbyaceae cyanobacterium bins.349]